MKKILFFISTLSFTAGAGAMELNLIPGRLPEQIEKLRSISDRELILKGVATSFDLTALRFLSPEVTTLDMSALSIRGCSLPEENWFGSKQFADGELPAYMLLAKGVTTVILPGDVSVIGKGAFSSTPLIEIKAPGVTTIGERAFFNCADLKKVDFSGGSFTTVPEYLFSGCSKLQEIHLPETVRVIGSHAFEKSGVVAISVPMVSSIGDYAFAYAADLSEISFANRCFMGEGAFYGTGSLEKIIGTAANAPALYSASSEGDSVLEIKAEEVGEGAFSRSKSAVIAIGEGVRSIGPYAFHSMPNLERVVAVANDLIPEVDPTAFAGNDISRIPLYVRRGETDRWRSAPVWQDFIITDEESGVTDASAEATDIVIARNGDMITVSSPEEITEITLFSIDGKMLSSLETASVSAQIPFPTGCSVVIVRASGKGGVKVAKLR